MRYFQIDLIKDKSNFFRSTVDRVRNISEDLNSGHGDHGANGNLDQLTVSGQLTSAADHFGQAGSGQASRRFSIADSGKINSKIPEGGRGSSAPPSPPSNSESNTIHDIKYVQFLVEETVHC